jgi:hypothetical protein
MLRSVHLVGRRACARPTGYRPPPTLMVAVAPTTKEEMVYVATMEGATTVTLWSVLSLAQQAVARARHAPCVWWR